MSGDSHSPEAMKKHIPLYWGIGTALFVLTIVTVAVSYLRLAIVGALIVAMIIATIKGSMVAAIFMHLKGEKKIIWGTLILCAFFFVVLMALPVLTTQDIAGVSVAPPTKMIIPEGHEGKSEAKEAAPAEAK